jgi:hypothetical protein
LKNADQKTVKNQTNKKKKNKNKQENVPEEREDIYDVRRKIDEEKKKTEP